MIGRLLRGSWAMLLYFALGTLVAEAIMLGYVSFTGRLTQEKLTELVAVLNRSGPAEAKAEGVSVPEEPPSEQPSFEQILEARSVKDKNLHLRELALANGLTQLKTELRKLSEDQKRFTQQRTEYASKLDALAKGAKTGGRDEVRRILEALKPKQAKEIVLGMLENSEEDEVVVLLSGMTDTKRAKILGEFKTPEETKKIEDVLRRIRQGVPGASLAEKAKGQLPQITTAPP